MNIGAGRKTVDLVIIIQIASEGFRHLYHLVDRPCTGINKIIGIFEVIVRNELLCKEHNVHHVKHVGGDIAGGKIELTVYKRFAREFSRPPRLFEVDDRIVKKVCAIAAVCTVGYRHRIGGENIVCLAAHEVGTYYLLEFCAVFVVAGSTDEIHFNIEAFFNSGVAVFDRELDRIGCILGGKELNVLGILAVKYRDLFIEVDSLGKVVLFVNIGGSIRCGGRGAIACSGS